MQVENVAGAVTAKNEFNGGIPIPGVEFFRQNEVEHESVQKPGLQLC